jgi:tRNA 2-thiouridine synthesizing protein A
VSDGDERGTSERPSEPSITVSDGDERGTSERPSEPSVTVSDADELVLDCRGMRCPMPVIELARHIGEVPVGGTVVVVATDVAARVDVPAWCRMRGQEYVGEEVAEDGTPALRVRRVA